MVGDIGEAKRHIKPKADSTLRNMRKDDLIKYIRCLEHNYNVGATFLENQARYIESLDVAKVVHGYWIDNGGLDEDGNGQYRCSQCGAGEKHNPTVPVSYCWNFGAKMDGERKNE